MLAMRVPPSVAVTGACGRIGRALVEHLGAHRYPLMVSLRLPARSLAAGVMTKRSPRSKTVTLTGAPSVSQPIAELGEAEAVRLVAVPAPPARQRSRGTDSANTEHAQSPMARSHSARADGPSAFSTAAATVWALTLALGTSNTIARAPIASDSGRAHRIAVSHGALSGFHSAAARERE